MCIAKEKQLGASSSSSASFAPVHLQMAELKRRPAQITWLLVGFCELEETDKKTGFYRGPCFRIC